MQSAPTRRELLAWLVAFALITTFAVGFATHRAEGSSEGRTESTVEGSSAPVPEIAPPFTPRVVYIATGTNFPDALGAGATAAIGMGPVLFVTRDTIPTPTLDELNRLEPNKIVIVGGTAVVSDTVKTALEGLSFSPTVTRIAGTNRYDTAAQLSASVFNTRGFYPRMTAAEATDEVVGDNSNQVALTINHTVDLPGAYTIFASADTYAVTSGADTFECWIEVDDVRLESSRRWISVDEAAGNAEENCTTQGFSFALIGGTYKIEFVIAGASPDVEWEYRNMIAHWTPYYPGS